LADIVFLILLILHVGFVVGWLGGAVLFVSIIVPSLPRISASSRIEFTKETLPRYGRYLRIMTGGAIVAGLLLYYYITRVATSLAPSGAGMPFIDGGVLLGLIAAILVFGVVIPTINKLVKVLKQGPATGESTMPEAARLQRRLSLVANSAIGVLSLALILMLIGASI
jgi:hypothetical protein